MKYILYIANHKPSGVWDFVKLEEGQQKGLAQGTFLEKNAERLLHHYIEEAPSIPMDILGVINQIKVTEIGYEENGVVIFNEKAIEVEED